MTNLEWRPLTAGADEAGRGPLAGPVLGAAVVLPPGFDLRGLNDSKKLTVEQRERLRDRIVEGAHFAIARVEPAEIDQLNILWASMKAMRLALLEIQEHFTHVLIDGSTLPPDLPWPAEPVVKGDAKYAAIAAASILAKTTRDEIMIELSRSYPQYGFDRHFGYPTPEHLAALREHGPCEHHRRSFGPVRDLIYQPCLTFDD